VKVSQLGAATRAPFDESKNNNHSTGNEKGRLIDRHLKKPQLNDFRYCIPDPLEQDAPSRYQKFNEFAYLFGHNFILSLTSMK
jgi:hypothetical protein